MKIKTIASALGLVTAATLVVADGAYARRSGGDHHGGAAYAGGFRGSAKPGWQGSGTRWVGGSSYPGTYDPARGYYRGWSWGGAAAVAAKAAARAVYDTRDYDFLHRCYEPQRIWNGAYYAWQLVSVC